MKYKYDVMPAYAQKCTRRTHTVSCGWSIMCMIWCTMSHTFEHSGHQQVNCCMHHVLTNIGRPLLPCCWGYSLGLFWFYPSPSPLGLWSTHGLQMSGPGMGIDGAKCGWILRTPTWTYHLGTRSCANMKWLVAHLWVIGRLTDQVSCVPN